MFDHRSETGVEMNNPPICDRREFAVGSAAFAAGLLLNGNSTTSAEERALTKKRLVLLGINALARSPEMNYFADGHRGASMISAHLMCVNNKLDDAAAGRIVELCQTFADVRITAGLRPAVPRSPEIPQSID